MKMETGLGSESSCFFKKLDKEKIVSVTFTCTVFSLLFICDDLVMQALVWLSRGWFRAIRFGASYSNFI
jgi:hypothetical protein